MYHARSRSVLLVVIVTFLLPGLMEAQAIVASAGRTLYNKNILFRSFTLIQRQSVPGGGSHETFVQPVAVVYGLAPDWNVTVVAPFVLNDNGGLADTNFFVKYDGLYKKNVPGGMTRLSGEFGVQAPTGVDRFSTGAFAFSGELDFEITRSQKFLIADVQYQASTSNNEGVSVGDQIGFDLAVAHLLYPGSAGLLSHIAPNGFFGILEVNGLSQKRSETRVAELRNTGGATVLLSPGLQYFLRPNLILDFSVPIPIVRDLNGEQPKPLTSFLFGFRYIL